MHLTTIGFHLNRNRILLICPRFNGYHKQLKLGIEKKGYMVDIISYNEEEIFCISKLKYSVIILLRCLFSLFFVDYKKSESYARIENYIYLINEKNFNIYIESEIDKLISGEKLSCAIVIKGFGLSTTLINKLNAISDNNTILYQWDPLLRYPSIIKTYDYYKKVITFQSTDVMKYPRSIFYPTFYLKTQIPKKDDYEYDLCFVGIFAFGRYLKLRKIKKKCNSLNLNARFKLFTRNRLVRIFVPGEFLIDEKLDAERLMEFYSKSRCIVDLCHAGQDGITQRVFQAISMSKFVYSDTPDIVNLKNIHPSLEPLIFDFDTIDKFKASTRSGHSFSEAQESIERYELDNWLTTILDIK